jgi:hypothetical protein
MTDFRTPPPSAPEPGPQPDPMLQTGRRSSGWVWLFGIAVVAIVAVTFYGLNNQEPQTAANESAPQAQSSGETTGAAPQDQQDQQDQNTDQQNGKGDANAQQSGNSKQAAPGNSPNAAPPQKDQSGQTNQKPQQ